MEKQENTEENDTEEVKEEKSPRDTVRFWYEWLEDAKEAGSAHKMRADAAWRDYELETIELGGETKEKQRGGFGIYFSTCKHLEAAYYSQTPKTNAVRRFGIEDDLSNTGAFVIERLGTYFVESQDFDAVIEKAVQDFIHADKAAIQVITEENTDTIEVPVLVVPTPDGQFIARTAEGEEVPMEGIVQKGPNQYVQVIEEPAPKISLLPIGYDEIRHSPNARVESEITEKAFCITLNEEKVKERFFSGEESNKLELEELPWLSSKSDDDDEEEEPTKRLKIWEIVCDVSNKIYWVTDTKRREFLDVRPNEDKLRSRFPCTPFIVSNRPKKGLYPTPTHTHIKPYIDALNELWHRIRKLIPKIERKALLDQKLAEAIESLESDMDWASVKDLASMIEGTGDLRTQIQFLPLQELVQAIGEASNLIDTIGRYFNEHSGLPDILRGQANPNNAASTNATMAQAAHDRFKKNKRAVQTMCRDAIELCIDMALDKWSDRKIWKVAGMDYAEPEHQQRFAQALQMLRDDEERFIRIDIETDSTTFIDEVAHVQKAQALSQTITQGLATIGSAQNVEYIPILLRMLLITVEAMGGSEKHADEIRVAVEQMIQKKQGQQAQGQDPAAAIKAQEAQTKLQVAQMESQVDMAQAQMDMQQHQAEMPVKQAELQLKLAEAQLEREKIQLEYAKLGQDKELQDMKMLETAAKTAGTLQKEQLDTEQAEIDLAGKLASAATVKPIPARREELIGEDF